MPEEGNGRVKGHADEQLPSPPAASAEAGDLGKVTRTPAFVGVRGAHETPKSACPRHACKPSMAAEGGSARCGAHDPEPACEGCPRAVPAKRGGPACSVRQRDGALGEERRPAPPRGPGDAPGTTLCLRHTGGLKLTTAWSF